MERAERAWRRLTVVGILFALGFGLGTFVTYQAHDRHWFGIQENRTAQPFSEVGEERAGELAERFRPSLQFDQGELWRPLSVASLIEESGTTGAPHLFCQRGAADPAAPPAEPDCDPIQSDAEFSRLVDDASSLGNSSYVDIAGGTKEEYRGPPGCETFDCGTGPGSAIYYHVIDSNNRFYVDYWWFLRFNNFQGSLPGLTCRTEPTRAASLCGEHEGDWEGVTVVTPPGEDDEIDYLVYAAHSGTFRYSAAELKLEGTRPDVFIARGSHASYPQKCAKNCQQPLSLAVEGLVDLPEEHYDGGSEWERNEDDCPADEERSCLLALPRSDDERKAWTIWPGQWGAGCGSICGTGAGPGSPQSPGLQSRYQTPWCSTQEGAFICDGRTLGCGDWLGPLVVAVVCDPEVLTEGLKSTDETEGTELTVRVRGEDRSLETTPGVVQVLGDPLTPGCTVTVTGDSDAAEVLVRAQQGDKVVDARFEKADLTEEEKSVVSIKEGSDLPTILFRGLEPIERRILVTDSPAKREIEPQAPAAAEAC